MSQKQNDEQNPFAVQSYLQDIDYPVGKEELIDHAKSHDAPDEVIQMLGMIDDEQYESPEEVIDGVNQVTQEFESTQGGEQPSGGGARPQA